MFCPLKSALRDENKFLERVFLKNDYNADFITGGPDVEYD